MLQTRNTSSPKSTRKFSSLTMTPKQFSTIWPLSSILTLRWSAWLQDQPQWAIQGVRILSKRKKDGAVRRCSRRRSTLTYTTRVFYCSNTYTRMGFRMVKSTHWTSEFQIIIHSAWVISLSLRARPITSTSQNKIRRRFHFRSEASTRQLWARNSLGL